ncbi:MAG: hypothetical protein KAQ69_11100 [Spirochaetales bacterium]|nr:hypothetical protein [Spirochaetales bacterium]
MKRAAVPVIPGLADLYKQCNRKKLLTGETLDYTRCKATNYTSLYSKIRDTFIREAVKIEISESP